MTLTHKPAVLLISAIALVACQHHQDHQAEHYKRPVVGEVRTTEVIQTEADDQSASGSGKRLTGELRPEAIAVAPKASSPAQLRAMSYARPSVMPGSVGAVSPSGDQYETLYEGGYRDPLLSPLSTFGLDVDTASYSNMRRHIQSGQLPPADALRLEELLNYFDYPLPTVSGEHPVALHTSLGAAPWDSTKKLAMVQVKARDLDDRQARPNRFVFLVDTSGSMRGEDRLPLLKKAFLALTERLDADDRVAIVTYAGSAGVALPAVSGKDKTAIYRALQSLESGGSTAGAQGILTAYQLARAQFDPNANNRVILATDGDFNVGPRRTGDLVELIEQHRDQGIYLTVLGFGHGNLGDGRMNRIAGHGDGNYYYIDSELEARRVLVDKLQRSLTTVAKDVKIQVEFNPRQVAAYRLLGYQTRRLAAEDFKDDRKDAGDLGAGQVVTALYEIQPGQAGEVATALRYQQGRRANTGRSDELMWVKLRYRSPAGGTSREISSVLKEGDSQESDNLRWAATVAELGLLLKDSEFRGQASYSGVIRRAEALLENSRGGAEDDLRREFVGLARQADLLWQRRADSALSVRR
ncbi:VWA domain-containing protein [Spongiibacter nanhainus]|uniref:VWA domain-containing protein n=1 Tax=Spongiibacter nanhainus TaxID=2794344 RepID=A0A7T4UQ20_9GAMM|nr:VWA domain-containing protein [Spongiibacter nanhainus]QQD17633.1 VWA domain-containing protein [Spongiibacter nanhainus]